jgi:thioesterase domain-containing protein
VPSGKLDRKAIPASIEAHRAAATAAPFAPPLTPSEKRIAAMWRRTLGVARVARGDNFFDLGGDSLTATTFIVDLEAALKRPVPAGLLFESPTLESFAAALDAISPMPLSSTALPRHLHDQVRRRVAGWKGTRARPEALIVGRNTLGALPALFWGATQESEFSLLGQALDPNRPLYAMRSLSKLRGKSEANTRLLAAHFAEEIEAIQPDGDILIGGFCEGGKLAFHTAQALVARGREIKALLLHNRFIPEPWDRPVAMFWGQTLWLNAHDVSAAERGWNRFYSGPLAVQTLPYEHGDIYVEGHIDAFARQLEAELDRIEAGGEPAYVRQQPFGKPLPAQTYAAEVAIRAPLMSLADSEILVPVRVRNTGTETWLPSSESGIVLCASWRNFDNYPRVPLDGYARIEQPVQPGGAFIASLRLRVPRTNLPVQLHVDLFEEGVGWFAERGGRSAQRIVLPLAMPLGLRGSRRAG